MPDKKKPPRARRGQHYKRSAFLADELARLQVERQRPPLRDMAAIGAGMIPGVGEVLDVYDTAQAVRKRDLLGAGFGLLSLVLPGIRAKKLSDINYKKLMPGWRGDPRFESGGGTEAMFRIGPFKGRAETGGWTRERHWGEPGNIAGTTGAEAAWDAAFRHAEQMEEQERMLARAATRKAINEGPIKTRKR